MKKLLLFIIVSMLLPPVSAQIVGIRSIERLAVPPCDEGVKVSAISPQGDYVLLTTASNKGLTQWTISTQESRLLTQAQGAGYRPVISPDGCRIAYRKQQIDDNHLRMTAINEIDLANSGSPRQLRAPSRTAIEVSDKPVLSVKNRQLMLTHDGVTSVFSPNGMQESYIWPSLSPDGTRALYYVCGVGAFSCRLDGTEMVSLGTLRAPQWYSDDIVVGMNDVDDGHEVISSSIVAMTLDGMSQTLTSDNVIAMFPQVAPKAARIVFTTPDDEVFLIQLDK